jgi:hypothetical protein
MLGMRKLRQREMSVKPWGCTRHNLLKHLSCVLTSGAPRTALLEPSGREECMVVFKLMSGICVIETRHAAQPYRCRDADPNLDCNNSTCLAQGEECEIDQGTNFW